VKTGGIFILCRLYDITIEVVMNSKYVDQLLKKAIRFEKVAQDNRGDKFWNEPVLPPKLPAALSQVFEAMQQTLQGSHILIEDLDAGTQAQGPGYKLFGMQKSNTFPPDPQAFLGLVQALVDRVGQLPDTDSSKELSTKAVLYFQAYANQAIKKFFQTDEQKPDSKDSQKPQSQQQQQEDDATKYATETLAMFLTRLYGKLRAGKPLSDFDNSKLPVAKPTLQRRLNGLNGLATRTPAQEQERQLIQYVLGKV
jgi:hypothetical protein